MPGLGHSQPDEVARRGKAGGAFEQTTEVVLAHAGFGGQVPEAKRFSQRTLHRTHHSLELEGRQGVALHDIVSLLIKIMACQVHGDALGDSLHQQRTGFSRGLQFDSEPLKQHRQRIISTSGYFAQTNRTSDVFAGFLDRSFQQWQAEVYVHHHKGFRTGHVPAHFVRHGAGGQEKIPLCHFTCQPVFAGLPFLNSSGAAEHPDNQRFGDGGNDNTLLDPLPGEDLHQNIVGINFVGGGQALTANVRLQACCRGSLSGVHGCSPFQWSKLLVYFIESNDLN
ncbi:hypothetical protein D3C84_535750 [compost metagenome]